ncbi:MAG: kelch repeat-containing protein, partial [Acidimicrobiales bacterium]|nr:kelch repeat-containing protein [Acidimicrobiales bacterium]
MRVWTATLLLTALVAVACSDDGPAPAPTTAPAVTASAAPAELPVPRTEVAAATLDGRIVVAGGLTIDGAASDRVDIYDPAANRWEPA